VVKDRIRVLSIAMMRRVRPDYSILVYYIEAEELAGLVRLYLDELVKQEAAGTIK
jgi:hypothetical protein